MDQEIKNLMLKDLVLWTENPRDPIDENAKDQDIVDKALADKRLKWTLPKLAEEMGDYYDLSELPTVVNRKGKYIVYDGNRRIILGKIKHKLVTVNGSENIDLPEFPEELPCNVCTDDIALKNVLRKHGDSGSWDPLERDKFLYKFMGKSKSTFLIIEEDTKLISANPHLNKGFVRDETLTNDNLRKLGFEIKDGHLSSIHNAEQVHMIFDNLSKKIKDKIIYTRGSFRGKAYEALDQSTKDVIDSNKKNTHKKYTPVNFQYADSNIINENSERLTPRKKSKDPILFGKKLILKSGNINNLYRDINDLYQIYIDNKNKFSKSFPSLIRMSLRLLCETAAKDIDMKKIDPYLRKYFVGALKGLDKNNRTTLSSYGINGGDKLIELLHVGAHNYDASNDLQQTYAISLILGEMLIITHGKKK